MRQDGQDGEADGAWRRRFARGQLWGLSKLLGGVACLGLLAGLGLVYRGPILELFAAGNRAVPPFSPQTRAALDSSDPREPSALLRTEARSELAGTTRKVVEAEERQARELLAQGQRRMRDLDGSRLHYDLAGARAFFDQAAGLRATRETHDEAVAWASRAADWRVATQHISISLFAAEEEAFRLRLAGSGTRQGLREREDGEHFYLVEIPADNPVLEGKHVMSIPKTEILERQPLALEARRVEFRAWLGRVQGGLDWRQAEDLETCYRLVYLCKRLNLADEFYGFMERARSLAAGDLADRFRKIAIDDHLRRASLLAAAGHRARAEWELTRMTESVFPGYRAARDEAEAFRAALLDPMHDDYRSTLTLGRAPAEAAARTARELSALAQERGGRETLEVNSARVAGQGAAAPLVERANRLYAEGVRHFNQYRQGSKGRNNEVLKTATRYLEEAVEEYGKALELDKENRALEDRQVEANAIRFFASRLQYHE